MCFIEHLLLGDLSATLRELLHSENKNNSDLTIRNLEFETNIERKHPGKILQSRSPPFCDWPITKFYFVSPVSLRFRFRHRMWSVCNLTTIIRLLQHPCSTVTSDMYKIYGVSMTKIKTQQLRKSQERKHGVCVCV